MNIDKIINEEINNYINEEILFEISKREKLIKKNAKRAGKGIKDLITKNKNKDGGKSIQRALNVANSEIGNKGKTKKKKEKGSKETGKNAKKLKNGLRTDFNYKLDRETNPNLNNQDSEDLIDILDSPYVDLAAVAQDIYPDHTPEGAQSQLRKKVKGLKSDSGSTYKIKKKEAFKIRRALAKEIN